MPALTLPLAACADRLLQRLAQATGSQAIAGLDGATLLGERAMLFRFAIPGRTSSGGGCRLYDTRDGLIALNLARQTDVTARRFAGKEPRDRSLAADDGALYAFVETARARMSDVRARVFVVADSDYVRGRTAYHLYPRNVFFTPTRNEMPPRAGLKHGDYLVVYQRHGVQYSAADRKLCWEGAEPVAAEAVLVAPGAAVFRVE
jgi:hypothetical protein